jgi:hypothetical protein
MNILTFVITFSQIEKYKCHNISFSQNGYFGNYLYNSCSNWFVYKWIQHCTCLRALYIAMGVHQIHRSKKTFSMLPRKYELINMYATCKYRGIQELLTSAYIYYTMLFKAHISYFGSCIKFRCQFCK